jgi:calmodulin
MSKKDVAQARKEFEFFDKDNNGKIDYQEFVKLLTVLSPKTDASYFEQGFSWVDEDDDGFVDFDEFLSWWEEAEWDT